MIILKVTNREIRRATFDSVIGHNSDYKVKFVFDEEWNGVTKTARFVGKKGYKDVILENDECTIPVEVLIKGCIYIGVYSSNMTTTDVCIGVSESIKDKSGKIVIEPTQDIYEQLLARLDSIEQNTIQPEVIEKAVTNYLDKNPIKSLSVDDVTKIVFEYIEGHKDELKGDKGEPGADGYIPVRGTDYWTSDDIAKIQTYIDNQIGGALNGSY